jgi:Tfp pilus assembly protein PilV
MAGTGAGTGAGTTAEAGFAIVEMLVAMVLLSLVGLTLARFQTFQLAGTANAAAAAAARLEADNRAIDLLAAPEAPTTELRGTSSNMGRVWLWTATPGEPPQAALMPDVVRIDIALRARDGGPVLASRTVLRPRRYADAGDAVQVSGRTVP